MQKGLTIKKGDEVLVITGKDKGRTGTIIRSFPQEERVTVEGINMRKKHVRAQRRQEKGETVLVPSPLHVSNVQLICPSCSEPTRVGHRTSGSKKVRVCKKCSSEIA